MHFFSFAELVIIIFNMKKSPALNFIRVIVNSINETKYEIQFFKEIVYMFHALNTLKYT